MRCALLLLCCSAALLGGQDPVHVGPAKTVTLSVPGATAAFSLDSFYADASVQNGIVSIFGKNPGGTHVIVLTGSDTISIPVVVPQQPPVLPPGFRKPVDKSSQNFESGAYEIRYSSDPAQLQNVLAFFQQRGAVTGELFLNVANRLSHPSDEFSLLSFPVGYYRLRNSRREFTLMDQTVNHSPLTVNAATIRGLHYRGGPWIVHAGYNSFATFENLFLPKVREGVAGIGYRHPLSRSASLTPNVFYFSHDQGDGKRGALGSLAYQYEPRDDFTVISEIGFSRGLGGAVTLDYNRDGERFYGAVRYEPPNFASLSINNFRGLFSDLFWTRQIGPRLRSDITVSSSRYNTTRMQQRNTISNFGLQYQINRWLTLHGGGGYSSFRSRRDDPSPVSTLAAPIGINVHLGRIGGGLQYQYGHNTGRDLGSQQLRASLYGNWRGFNLSTSMDRQTFVPTAGQIVAEIPGLQQILDRMGVSATTPGELAELIRQNAMLAALGYAEDLVVNLSPLRLQYWGMVGWSGKRQYAPRFSLSSLYNRNESVNAIALNVLHSGTYIQKLSGSTDFFLTYSRMRTVFSGRPWLYRPVVTASLRRRLQRTPPLLLNGGRGTIAGIVFQDDQARGRYQVGMSGLEGVEVVLDGGRKTRTDRSGRFHFSGVSYGEHKVEVNFSSSRPFFFSTSSYAICSEKGRLEFGIGYARSRIIGYARTDSGQPLAGLEVRIESAGVATGEPLKVQTDGVGRFEASGLESGVYTVSIEPQTVPPGYALGSINAETVKVAEDSPGRIQFVVPAYRNLGGQVRAYDKVAAAYVPMPRLTVELRELAIKTITDANGGYLFRNLPPGDYTVAVTLGGREFLKKATMPDEPTFLKGVDISIVGR